MSGSMTLQHFKFNIDIRYEQIGRRPGTYSPEWAVYNAENGENLGKVYKEGNSIQRSDYWRNNISKRNFATRGEATFALICETKINGLAV